MAITIACLSCACKMRAPDNLAGRKIKCPKCGAVSLVPSLQPVAARPADQSERPAREEEAQLSPNETLDPSSAGRSPHDAGDTIQERPNKGNSDSSAASASNTQPDGAAWPAGFSSQDASSYLLPPLEQDEIGRLGDYRVLKVLGVGGMGVVFLAEDPQLKRLLALKAMKPAIAARDASRQRFLREAQAAAAIEHDHVITIYQVGETRGIPFLAMPLLKGESLEQRLRRDGSLPLPEVLRIGREVAHGLAAAHALGLIHRDIKPSNIWLEGTSGRVKILDFGLARGKDDPQLTHEGGVVGTPAYMAPEQADGQAVDQRCDLFSLGCVLYRMCAGKAPFQGKDVIGVLKKVLLDTPLPLDDLNPAIPAELTRLVKNLMDKNPEVRPASARLVANTLNAIEERERGAVRKPRVDEHAETVDSPMPRQRRDDKEPARSHGKGRKRSTPPWVWALAGGTVVLLIGLVLTAGAAAAWYALRQKPEDIAPVPQAALKQPEEKPAPKVIEKQLDEKMPKGWMSFSPAGGRFALFLPGEPKESKTVSQTVRGPIENHTFTIEAGRNSYAVAWFDFKGVVPQGPQIKGALDGGQKGMLDRMGDINILKQDDIDLNGFPGREVVFDSADKKSTLTVRLYLVKQRCYTLIATAPQGKSDQPEVRQFFDSFRLTP